MVGIEDERLMLMLRYFSMCFHILCLIGTFPLTVTYNVLFFFRLVIIAFTEVEVDGSTVENNGIKTFRPTNMSTTHPRDFFWCPQGPKFDFGPFPNGKKGDLFPNLKKKIPNLKKKKKKKFFFF